MQNKLDLYKDEKPTLDIREYFNGKIKAWGIIQDWSGKVTSRFDVTMEGKWDGDNGTLAEDFVFYNGEKMHRTWNFSKNIDGTYLGKADDIIGEASGDQQGNSVRWRYAMDVPYGGSKYRLYFDDWMWAMNDGIVINRSYLKKWGITVAELTLFMQKEEQ